ncbi:MAG: acetate/propionate family kinase [Patescibacteria group bacterium]
MIKKDIKFQGKRAILVLNTGSTSLKYQFFDFYNLDCLLDGVIENIGLNEKIRSHSEALRKIFLQFNNLNFIAAVGYRFVHGGREFIKPTRLDEDALKKIEVYNKLAPLHNPYSLAVARLAMLFLPDVTHLAVFDTSFFSILPLASKVYALPFYFYKQGVQRFGFHGISHEYVAQEAAKLLKKDFTKINLIICHLGGGCSITAIKKGRPIDTSMGFTPLEGLVMQTRSGDLDPGIIFYLHNSLKLSIAEINDILNHHSGLLGLSGRKNYLSLLKGARRGDRRAKLAFEIFVNRIKKYIGAYSAILEKVDALVFTGAIGAGEAITRQRIIKNLKILNKSKIFAIKTNEELAIARILKKEILE